MNSNPLDTPWRASYEAISGFAWAGTGMALAASGFATGSFAATSGLMGLCCLTAGAYRFAQTIQLFERKLALMPEAAGFITPEGIVRLHKESPDHVWLGKGFDWEQDHTQLAFTLRKLRIPEIRPPAWYCRLRGYNPTREQIGAPWIHGLEPTEDHVRVPIDHLEGHTLIVGTTGAGKTRAFETLITQAVLRKECVIVIDPKGDRDLRVAVQRACMLANRPEAFLNFHPAFPEYSVRLDPCRNYNRASEIASRIAALVNSDGDNSSFVAFGWRVINAYVQGMDFIGERPTLASIRRNMDAGPDILLFACLRKFLDDNHPGWHARLHPYRAAVAKAKRPSATTSDDLLCMVALYKAEIMADKGSQVVDGLVSMFEHSREHAGKMLATLGPVIEMLTSGTLGQLLSPDLTDFADPRPVVDSAKIINEGLVLYLGTDGLADGTVSGALGSIILADLCSVAGDRYNYGTNNTRINLFIDEASDVVNDPCISLLNKGRGAGFVLTIATQTFPDFIARVGDEAKARKILGNLNNLIALRTKDAVTQEYITETMGSASVMTTMHTHGTTAISGNRDPTNYNTNYGERLVETPDAELFSPDLLTKLPNLHYIASVSGGRVVKGRFPFLRSNLNPRLEDMAWVKPPDAQAMSPIPTTGLPSPLASQ